MTRMLVTRPAPEDGVTVQRLAGLGIDAVACPLLRRIDLHPDLPPGDAIGALAITSANALRALAATGQLEHFRHLPLYAVGDGTARIAAEFGFATIANARGTIAELAACLVRQRPDGVVLHPSGVHRAGDLATLVAADDILVKTIPVYEMVAGETLPEAIEIALGQGQFSAALFYSARTAKCFAALAKTVLGGARRDDIDMLCLSRAVAEPLIDDHYGRISLADTPDDAGMMRLAQAFAHALDEA